MDVACDIARRLLRTALRSQWAGIAIALAGTIVANMCVKIGVTLVYAKAKGRSAAIALIASTFVLAASIAVAWVTMV